MESSLNLTSHDSQNQLISIAAQQVLRTIADEVHRVGFFCLMADEARSFRDEQLAFCVRYAVDLEVRERFMMFVNCSECRDADGITKLLMKTADTAGLRGVPIVAQAYDGASVMSGKDNGVQKQVRDIHPAALYVHCMAHKLNLVIVASCMTTRYIVSFFSNLQSLYVFFSRPGNDKSFNACRDQLGISAKTALKLTDLSDTRWVCRWRNVNATKQSLNILIGCLKQLSKPGSLNRCLAEASGLLNQMQQREFIVCLVVLDKVLSQVQVVHALLQKKNMTLAQASRTVANTVAALDKIRSSDKEWNQMWKEICQLEKVAEIRTDADAVQPNPNQTESLDRRRRQIKKVSRMEDFLIMETCGQREQHLDTSVTSRTAQTGQLAASLVDDGKEWQTQVFFPVVDSVVSEMKRRFLDHEILKVAKAADAVMTMSDDDCAIDYFLQTYGGIIHVNSALTKAEMKTIKSSVDVLKRFNPSLSNTAEAQRFCIPFPATTAEVTELKNYPNFFKLLQLVITLPVSSATCERSFSAMRRVRNYLRSTMTEDRFTSLSLLHIEGELSSSINAHDVVAHYAETGNRRLQFY